MKLGRLEMKALISIILVLLIFSGAIVYIGNKNHWLTPTKQYLTTVSDGDALRVGGKVTLAGLLVGRITKLRVDDDNKIEIQFEVYTTMTQKIIKGTKARIVRAFLIGEKSIDLLPGPKGGLPVVPGTKLVGIDSMEIPDLISGKNMGDIFSKVEGIGKGMDKLFTAFSHFSTEIKSDELTNTWKLLNPFLKNTNTLTKHLIQNKLIKRTLIDTRAVLAPLKKNATTVDNLLKETNTLVMGLAKNPQFADEISVALKEIIVTLKAAQKTWLLEGHVEDLKKKKE
jgi:phospholipid/cholesterol/gamma-HCH transport system substrate-binding protein